MSNLTIPDEVLMWKFGGKPGNLTAQNEYFENSGYNLLCLRNNKFLNSEEMPFGINLDYTSDADVKTIHFRLPDKQEREILTGELVAVGVGEGDAFLRYGDRSIGINLEWSEDPVYEWRIYGANVDKGKPIPTGAAVAIANIKVDPAPDFLVYLDREPPGVADIGWTSSPDFWEAAFDRTAKAAVEAIKKAIF